MAAPFECLWRFYGWRRFYGLRPFQCFTFMTTISNNLKPFHPPSIVNRLSSIVNNIVFLCINFRLYVV